VNRKILTAMIVGLFATWAPGVLAGPAGAGALATSVAAEAAPFAAEEAPDEADWRYFHLLPESERRRLWTLQSKAGKQLKDWSWGWRLGWIRSCANVEEDYCNEIMRQGLRDRALVVRAEAATQLGRSFAGSRDPEIVELLQQAYLHRGNLRRGKPLYVQERILFALKQVGGRKAVATGSRLAGKHPEAKDYWKKLNRM